MIVNNRENAPILSYFKSKRKAAIFPVNETESGLLSRINETGTSPELVDYFWNTLGGDDLKNCRFAVYGTVCFLNPNTGIIFGFCGGSMTYAIRLVEQDCRSAMDRGYLKRHDYPAYPTLGVNACSLDLAQLGRTWVFGQNDIREREWLLRAMKNGG